MYLIIIAVTFIPAQASLDPCTLKNQLCIFKCCNKGFAYVSQFCEKVDTDFNLDIIIYDGIYVTNTSSKIVIVYGKRCNQVFPLEETENAYIQRNGSLFHPEVPIPKDSGFRTLSRKEEYCLETKDGKTITFLCADNITTKKPQEYVNMIGEFLLLLLLFTFCNPFFKHFRNLCMIANAISYDKVIK